MKNQINIVSYCLFTVGLFLVATKLIMLVGGLKEVVNYSSIGVSDSVFETSVNYPRLGIEDYIEAILPFIKQFFEAFYMLGLATIVSLWARMSSKIIQG